MLKILDYTKWLDVYKTEMAAATVALDPLAVDGFEEAQRIVFYELPFRQVTELHSAFHIQEKLIRINALTMKEQDIIGNAYKNLNERVMSFIAKSDIGDQQNSFQSRFSASILMLIENPIALILKSVGQVELRVTSRHGVTNLMVEKSGKSLVAKVMHRQDDPTYAHLFPEILETSGWVTNYFEPKSMTYDRTGFQALIGLRDNRFEESLSQICREFSQGLSKSIHNLGEDSESSRSDVQIQLDVQDELFDIYLRDRTYWIHKLWMHNFLHITLNGNN